MTDTEHGPWCALYLDRYDFTSGEMAHIVYSPLNPEADDAPRVITGPGGELSQLFPSLEITATDTAGQAVTLSFGRAEGVHLRDVLDEWLRHRFGPT